MIQLRRQCLVPIVVGLAFLAGPAVAAQVAAQTSQTAASTGPAVVITVPNPPNTPEQQRKHYVVLVSLDGFRYDYPQKYAATHLLALGKRGARTSQGMLPSYPSLTFPNHYTMVTGLYPEHHGIVANSFYDPARKQTYSYRNSEFNADGSWYGGVPLWSLAEQQGMRSACFFWPGSEAEIAGKRPSYYLHFDDAYPDERRIDQIIAWLQLPVTERPHLITLYYSNVDHEGHLHGPDSPEVRAAVHHVDGLMGELTSRLDRLHLPIDLVVVADHGMIATEGDFVTLDKAVDLGSARTEGSLLYPADAAETERIYQQFQQHPDPKYKVYRRADVPAALYDNANPREGDPVIVPTGPYPIRAHANPKDPTQRRPTNVGEHGFDPHTMPEMKAIFFAAGPDIRKNVDLPSFENVNLYGFLSQILGLTPAPNDGSPATLAPALRHPRR